jgi:hypothetical protein
MEMTGSRAKRRRLTVLYSFYLEPPAPMFIEVMTQA